MLNLDQITDAIPSALQSVNIPGCGEKISGKVRDIYRVDDKRILITTDRISAFDSVLGHIPHRGQVLNQLSAWWFERTEEIIPNHLIKIIDPNVTVAHEADPIPVEVVVRGYLTGVTSTSMWTLYKNGDRSPYGIDLPDGMQQFDPLPEASITPTTKAKSGHDRVISREEIIETGLVEESLWEQIEAVSKKLFALGQRMSREHRLVLVDTKYEFGLINGELHLIDELHTPDSSRFWTASSHAKQNPQHFDKEYMRQWFVRQGYKGDGTPPPLSDEVAAEIAQRYISVYERISGERFRPGAQPAEERIVEAVQSYLGL